MRLVDSLSLAERRARAGVRRLFAIAEHRELRAHVVWLPRWDEMQRFAITLTHQRTLAEQVMDLLADLALRQVPLPRDADLRFVTSRDGVRVGITLRVEGEDVRVLAMSLE